MAGVKRGRDSTVMRSIGHDPISISDIGIACIRRNDLFDACSLACFAKYLRFGLIRATLNPKEGAALLPILGLGRPSSKPYPIGSDASKTTSVTIRVRLPPGATRPHADVKITQVSNSSSTPAEQSAVLANGTVVKLGWKRDDLKKLALDRGRMVRDARSGKQAATPSGVWGSKRSHCATVLLRSWIAEPGTVRGSASRWRARHSIDGSSAAGPAKESSTEADYFRVCLAETAKPGDNFGTGPSRWGEKWRGEFSFLVQSLHTSKGEDAGRLDAISVPGHPVYDEAQPEVTAWRAVRGLLGDSIPMVAFRNAIVAHFDCAMPAASVTTPASAGASSAGRAASVHMPPAISAGAVRQLKGEMQFFVVDADALARGVQFGLEKRATADDFAHKSQSDLSPNPGILGAIMLGSLKKLAEDAAGEGVAAGNGGAGGMTSEPAAKARRVDGSPKELAWVPESHLTQYLPSETVSVLQARGKIVAQQGTDSLKEDEAGSSGAAGGGGRSCVGAGGGRGVSAFPAAGRALLLFLRGLTAGHADQIGRFFPARRGCTVRLFHGTKLSLAKQLHAEGFRRPMCRNLPACRGEIVPRDDGGPCRCQMEGFGVYFGRREKAMKFATRRAEFDKERGCNVGAIIVADVDLGFCKKALAEPCPCGCGMLYVDHLGSWYARDGFDSLYVADNSMPASATAEWCVADPARIRIVEVVEVVTADSAKAVVSNSTGTATGAGGGEASAVASAVSSDSPPDYDELIRREVEPGT